MREFAQVQVEARLERVLAEMERTRVEPEEDAVHDLRTSIRRLSQGLRLFGELVGEKKADELRRKVRPVLKLAGEVRNRDIAMELAAQAGLGANSALIRELQHQRAQQLQQLTDLLTFYRDVPLRPRWSHTAEGKRWEPGLSPAENARSVLPKMAKKFMRQGDDAVKESTSWTQLHQFRLKGKRFRYTLELFQPVYGPGLEKRLASLKKVQTALGEINDCETMLGMEPAPRYPRLVKWLEAQRLERREHFIEFWGQEFGAKQEQQWMDYLRRYAR